MKKANIQLNFSPSMPIGFYRATSLAITQRYNIADVCLPKAIAKKGLQQGYLTKGKCSSGTTPVVKEVIAVPHDTVELTAEGFIVNGEFYQAPWHKLDSKGARIKHFLDVGIYISINNYWLYDSHAPHRSCDSRYFGDVAQNDLIYIIQSN